MADDFPTSWSDEPWPLEEPERVTFRPRTWSDTHDAPPQVADLADEAMELADRYGYSMEQALVAAQRRRAPRFGHLVGTTAGVAATGAILPAGLRQAFADAIHDEIRQRAAEFQEGMRRIAEVFGEVDWDRITRGLEELADESEKPKPHPPCPRHGPVTKGGFCRRCGR